MKVNVVLITPQDDPLGGRCFLEGMEAMAETATRQGHESKIVINTLPMDGINIVWGWHLQDLPYGPNCILYNMEQLACWDKTHGTSVSLTQRLKGYGREVWDYSPLNIDILREAGVNATLVPIRYSPCLTRIEPTEEDLDVVFFGSINQRRKDLVQKLLDAGIHVFWLSDSFGEERDKIIARAKIMLNLHYYEGGTFEMLRVSYLLANNKFVITEPSPDIPEDLLIVRLKPDASDLVDLVRASLLSRGPRNTLADFGHEWMVNHLQTLPL